MYRRLTVASILLTLIAGIPLFAQTEDTPLWMRYPAISPDGSTIAFAYQGDLFLVDAGGGTASPLTLDEAHDFMPVWSRDGKQLAFASDRHGNYDVFVMPAAGGESTRLTFHSAADYPYDFSPDGSRVLFGSTRLDARTNAQFPSGTLPELYQIALSGGRPEQVLTVPAQDARWSDDGKRIFYHDRKGYEDPWRKHHRSSITRDLWSYDLGSGTFTRLTHSNAEERNPLPIEGGDRLVYLSEESGTFNVHRMPTDGSGVSLQLTRFDRHPVRFLSRSDEGTLCFGYHGEIYTMSPRGEPEKVAIRIRTDPRDMQVRNETLGRGVTEMALSPGGKEVAFVARGEVFVTSLETDVTKRLTDTPSQERMIDFSPDGRSVVYAGERDGSWNLYRTQLTRDEEDYFFQATVLEEESLLVGETDTFRPRFSPTGKELAYLENRTTLKILDLETKQSRTILPGERSFSYADGDQEYQWSPDGKWLFVNFNYPGYWIPQIGLVRADGSGELFDMTESGYFDGNPQWSVEGKWMTWTSNRDGLDGHSKAGPSEGDVYALFLTREALDRFRLTEEELEILKEQEEKKKKEEEKKKKKDEGDDDKKKKDKKGKDADETGEDEEDEEEKLPEVEIELDGIHDRKARLTIHSSRLSDFVVTPDGEKLLYLARFEKKYDLWVTELRTKETKILAKLQSDGGGLAMDKEGKFLVVLAGGSISKIEIESGKKTPVSFSAEMNLDRLAEREYIFDHACRQVREKFYDPDLHGVDWDALCRDYAPFVAQINHNFDFAEMLGELLGELNASHTGGRYRPQRDNPDQTASLGVFFDEAYEGNGLRIEEVMKKNPIAAGESKLRAGLILEKIDGVEIAADTNLYRMLNRKAGDNVLLSLYDPESDERWEERVKPLSRGEENELLYQRWIENRRVLTDELSGGRIGYVHVRGMNDRSYRSVQEEVLGRLATKEAIVIDTRFNGGGDLVDDLSIFLTGVEYMDFVSADGRSIGMEPSRRWTKPSIVIAGEGNYSDAHCFPWAYQTLEIGKVVGMPVPGTCTFVWWERQQDPTLIFGVPIMGIKDAAGRWLENLQLEPDVRVENEAAEVAAGRDQQLEAAVRELLGQL